MTVTETLSAQAEPQAAELTCERVLETHDPVFYCRSVPNCVEGVVNRRFGRALPLGAGIWIALILLVVLVGGDLAQRLPHFPWPELGWLLLLVIEIGALLTFPEALWDELKNAAGKIDDLLYDADNAKVATWLEEHLVPPAHFAWCLVGAAVGIGSSIIVSQFHWAAAHFVPARVMGPRVLVPGHWTGAPFSVSYYVATAILGFFAFDVIRWVWRSPLVLRHISTYEQLRINKLAPADTPSVRAMSELLAKGSLRAAIGLALFAAPFVWIIADSPNHTFRGYLAIFAGVPTLLAFMTTIYFSFVPQNWITEIMAAQQARVLEAISEPRLIDGDVTRPSEELDKTIKLYQTFAGGPIKPPAAQATTRNLAKVLLAIAPYAAAFAAKIAHVTIA
jgi:hypothetical protein